MRHGRCLCGAITYSIEGEPIIVAHCHCTDCRRLSGAGHTTGAMFKEAQVDVRGELAEFCMQADSGSTVRRSFCQRCGSSLFGRNTGMPGVVTVAVGSLDDPSGVEPQVAVFTRTRPSWDTFDPALPSFADQPAWRPEDGA